MKSKRIVFLISLLVVIAIILIVFMVLVINKKGIVFSNGISKNVIVDEVYSDDINNLNLDVREALVSIKRSNDENIRVKIYSEYENTSVNVSNNSLNIVSNNKPCKFICFNYRSTKIEIYLNKDYEFNMDIKNNYGDVLIDEFDNAYMNIKLDCGDLEIKSAKEAVIVNKYGDIDVGKILKANIKADAGDININEAQELVVNNNYGDINIKDINGYLDILDNCGDIEIDNLILSKNSKIKNDYGDIKIGETNQIYIDAKSNLGDVKISNNYRKSNIVLDIKNSCGDIEIDN